MLLSESIGAKRSNMVVSASAPEVRAHLDADVHAVGSGQEQPSFHLDQVSDQQMAGRGPFPFRGVLLGGHSRFNVGTQGYSSLGAGVLLARSSSAIGCNSGTAVERPSGAHSGEDHEAPGRLGKESVSCVPGADGYLDVHAATGMDELGSGLDHVADPDRAREPNVAHFTQ